MSIDDSWSTVIPEPKNREPKEEKGLEEGCFYEIANKLDVYQISESEGTTNEPSSTLSRQEDHDDQGTEIVSILEDGYDYEADSNEWNDVPGDIEFENIPSADDDYEYETNSNPGDIAPGDEWIPVSNPKPVYHNTQGQNLTWFLLAEQLGQKAPRDGTYFQEGWKEVGLSREEFLALERQTIILPVPRTLQHGQFGRVRKSLRDIYVDFPTVGKVIETPPLGNVNNIHISAPAHYKVSSFFCRHKNATSIARALVYQMFQGTGSVVQVRNDDKVIALLHYYIPPEPVVPTEVNGYFKGELVKGSVTWVESEEDYKKFLTYLHEIKRNVIELALDCVASRGLSRRGNVTHLTISVQSLDHTWVLCHTKLPLNFFDIADESSGKILRSILEDPEIQQLWFDVRSDSDALFGIYEIRLGHVIDVQLMEVAARYGLERMRSGLASLKECVSNRGHKFLSHTTCQEWLYNKRKGREFFQQYGYEILEDDPLPSTAKEYTAGDTFILFGLYKEYKKDNIFIGEALKVDLGALVKEYSEKRVEYSQDSEYNHDTLTREERSSAPGSSELSTLSTMMVSSPLVLNVTRAVAGGAWDEIHDERFVADYNMLVTQPVKLDTWRLEESL
ncbi:hypothetical protein HYALB_00003831 [Hymenoscyphus albidus]|uniref:3'-5' exonuclease domain-containing protein n=1 Tax=Hymenoscyphus albidus TaxID=595503 RepID=A0A9N9LUV4_9HELO|nr:hypothetical protein HYALB_00003831 [Hymenoscyphus albidus]